MLNYEQARKIVIQQIQENRGPRATAKVTVWDAHGLVLAQQVTTDRAYPPFHRSTRDGYAVRAAEATAGASLRCTGEIRAGDEVTAPLPAGVCVQIMTGAAVPAGADAVVMIEFTKREGDIVCFKRNTKIGQNIVPRGSEAEAAQVILQPGMRLGYAELALAAQVGAAELLCARKPRVAILSTGDEIVNVNETPGPCQIRNSNSVSLAAQVNLAGGEPVLLGNAADRAEDLRAKIEPGLKEEILVLSGGVSMGKYDLVEPVLKELGAEIYFDAVAIRPGKPVIFARCGDTFVFGLPGNPISTMVTFELFVTPALDLLSGADARPLPLVEASLSESLQDKPGLTHFLPARLSWWGTMPQVKPLRWQGSGDIASTVRANCFIVFPEEKSAISMGERVCVLLRKDVI